MGFEYKSTEIIGKDVADVRSELAQNTSRRTDWVNVTQAPYNAKGDGVADDTLSFQDAIDYCVANKKVLYVPTGTFSITQTLNVPGTLNMLGNNNGIDSANSIIKSSGITLFKQVDMSKLYPHSFIGLTFQNVGVSESAILFDIAFAMGLIERCSTILWNQVFNQNLKSTTKLLKNKFYSITGYFINNGGFTDCLISENYISGYQPLNPICFGQINISTTTITNNYFDYFKYCFYGLAGPGTYYSKNIISNNIFDCMYRCFYGTMNTSTISSNLFTRISEADLTAQFTNPDNEMTTNTPYALYTSGSYAMTRMIIVNNQFVCNAIYMSTESDHIYIRDNYYSVPAKNYGAFSNSTTEVKSKIFVDFLDKTEETALPLLSWRNPNGTYVGREIIYNNKVLRFIPDTAITGGGGGGWYDYTGNVVTA